MRGKAERGWAGRIAAWLAEEPFRVFFVAGAVWSVIGVSLWPLFYAGKLGFYPPAVHARLMIESFGGAFVAGFLGTAGPRIAGARRLSVTEFGWLFLLHTAGGACHLQGRGGAGDACFLVFLISLAVCLIRRFLAGRGKVPPPMVGALAGLACGVAGVVLDAVAMERVDARLARLAGLFLYQGFLLLPTLGIGSFLFPRMLGGGFGEANTAAEGRRRLRWIAAAVVLVVTGFFLEVYVSARAGFLLRAVVCLVYLMREIRWRRKPGDPPRGTLVAGLRGGLWCGFGGLALAGFFPAGRLSLEHLLYIGGFGMVILMVASRVLFGHSGNPEGFARKSWMARIIVFGGLLAALTRAVPAFVPKVTVSHHQYAAWTWGCTLVLWLLWHRKRFVTPDEG